MSFDDIWDAAIIVAAFAIAVFIFIGSVRLI